MSPPPSTRAAQLLRTQYKEGSVKYPDMIDAERTLLQSRRDAAQLQGLQAIASVNLIRAHGGGWALSTIEKQVSALNTDKVEILALTNNCSNR